MNRQVVATVSVLVLGGVLLPTLAQDDPAKPRAAGNVVTLPAAARDDAAKPKGPPGDESTLGALDEIRAREEVLRIKRAGIQSQLQHWIQLRTQVAFTNPPGDPGPGAEEVKQRVSKIEKARIGLVEAEDAYLSASRELGRLSRRRAELELQATDLAPKGAPSTPRAVAFIKAPGLYINPRQVAYVMKSGGENGSSRVEIKFVGIDRSLMLIGSQADSVIGAMERLGR